MRFIWSSPSKHNLLPALKELSTFLSPKEINLSFSKSLCLYLQRQRLINSRTYTNGESEVAIKIPIKHVVENGTGPSSAAERGVNGTRRDEDVAEAGNETENENEDNENNENDEEEDDDEEDHGGPYTPFDLPSKKRLGLCCSRKQNSAWVCQKASQMCIEVEVFLGAPSACTS